jgi:thiamine-monophosphate kinase
MDEFELIKQYFPALADMGRGHGLSRGIGDDCALVAPPANKNLAISSDTLISGVHFPENTPVADIGYKALAVNLSDLAAMGAEPLWFSLCITLPDVDPLWLKEFCGGMAPLVEATGITLIGGDTTRGPLSITIQVMGAVDNGAALMRDGARAGDGVYVTGSLGGAALGLGLWQGTSPEKRADLSPAEAAAIQQLHHPVPRLEAGQKLTGLASSCIDVSDGLLADLHHICESSGVGAALDLKSIPMHPALLETAALSRAGYQTTESARLKLALSGGDDYELCFTAPAESHDKITALSGALQCPVTRIGDIVPEPGLFDQASPGGLIDPDGYRHF